MRLPFSAMPAWGAESGPALTLITANEVFSSEYGLSPQILDADDGSGHHPYLRYSDDLFYADHYCALAPPAGDGHGADSPQSSVNWDCRFPNFFHL